MIKDLDFLPPGKKKILKEITSELSRVEGMAAIVLGGSYASGTFTESSDMDLGLYYFENAPFSIAKIRKMAEKFSEVKEPAVTGFYGWGAWVNGGGWLHTRQGKIDFLYRNIDQVKRTIAEAKSGVFQHDYDQQPAYGFYNVIYLAETSVCIPLYDPDKIIAGLKRQVQKYPPKLKRRIINDSLWSAEFTLINARSYAARGDVYGTAGCLTRAAAHLTQALFALNEKYYLTDKKAMELISGFNLVPNGFVDSVNKLLANPGANARTLQKSVNEMELAWECVVNLEGIEYTPNFVI